MPRLGFVLLLGLFLSTAGADERKPNTLTAEEIADGWLLPFDGETTFGWKATGEVRAAGGALIVGQNKDSAVSTTASFGAYRAQFEYQARGDVPAFLVVGQAEKAWRHPLLPPDRKEGAWNRVTLDGEPDGATLEITEASGNVINIHRPTRSFVGPLGFSASPGTVLTLRNVRLKPLSLKSILNGKDLAGWKRFDESPRNKSAFTVSDGALHIKNGPGDLQTTSKWGDFILQLECRSNGKHLNSGVFFRCRPGEYQQGYEAQIHNAFTEAALKEYVLDDYDPKTNQLTGKRKEKYQATDFGTGAIYRRQPARRSASSDYEWFTMTVVAHRRHLLVFVNGILVTDWTDHRPILDNARNGCRLEAGPISLQGHDPTTDLSFRNFRILELKPTLP